MTLDRTLAPDFHPVQDIQSVAVDTQQLDNGAPLYVVTFDQQPVMRLEVNFDAGTWYENASAEGRPGASFFAWKMLAEGTRQHTSAQISDGFDRYGAFLELNNGFDRGNLIVYCQPKHLGSVLPLVAELLTEATYPEKEFEDLRTITLQNLKVSFEKTAHIANVRLRQKLYGSDHPYGRSQNPDMVTALTRDDAVAFYDQHICQRPFRVLMAGQVGLTEIALVNQVLGQLPMQPLASPAATPTVQWQTDTTAELIDKAGSLQSSIRMGRILFRRDHPDFHKMLVTNEVLGGYFGSRLMKNIREEKGFTYGISSNVGAFRHAGQFMIGTDVKREFTQQTIDEVWKEIHRLQTEPVPTDELTVVQNYMAGEFVGSLNTPFEIADRYKLILLDGLPVDFLSTYIRRIRAVTAADIQEMAQTYFTPESMIEVVVGGKV
ncbi:peptidase M16 domain protein [Fibrella aestuarina BUZ 2]|uniref:Peptidase M16 domain protein n=1 Tax=Fibrella aestuarina BUZ 2 TaxID=1166018 RepID=I0K3X5_9BACT|nr:pitrilysin family protein [Fibrella aestuarina]CCG98828.1 peptidase M16 domain protein [Fibrella aestuarina BUZ 2]